MLSSALPSKTPPQSWLSSVDSSIPRTSSPSPSTIVLRCSHFANVAYATALSDPGRIVLLSPLS